MENYEQVMQNKAMVEKEPSILQQKVNLLNSNIFSFESRWKDLYGVIERLNRIAKKLNSVQHPDNSPKVEQTKNGISNAVPQPMPNDGLVGSLDDILNGQQRLLNEFDSNIHEQLLRDVNYIELHI